MCIKFGLTYFRPPSTKKKSRKRQRRRSGFLSAHRGWSGLRGVPLSGLIGLLKRNDLNGSIHRCAQGSLVAVHKTNREPSLVQFFLQTVIGLGGILEGVSHLLADFALGILACPPRGPFLEHHIRISNVARISASRRIFQDLFYDLGINNGTFWDIPGFTDVDLTSFSALDSAPMPDSGAHREVE